MTTYDEKAIEQRINWEVGWSSKDEKPKKQRRQLDWTQDRIPMTMRNQRNQLLSLDRTQDSVPTMRIWRKQRIDSNQTYDGALRMRNKSNKEETDIERRMVVSEWWKTKKKTMNKLRLNLG